MVNECFGALCISDGFVNLLLLLEITLSILLQAQKSVFLT